MQLGNNIQTLRKKEGAFAGEAGRKKLMLQGRPYQIGN